MKKLFTRVVRTALLAMCALMALPASADKTLYLQNDGGWTSIQVWAWGAGGDVFSTTYGNRPDILNFDSSKVNSERTFAVTKGKVGDNVVYKIVVDDNCTNIRFGTNEQKDLTDFNNKLFTTNSYSATDFSGTWTEGDVVAIPAALYVCGNINGSSDWKNTTPVSMTQNGNVFSIPSVNVSGSTNNNNYVGFTTDNTKPDSEDTRYGLSTSGTEISDFTKSYELALKGYGFKLAEGNYSLKVDFTDSSKPVMTIAKAGTTEQVKTPAITQSGNQVSISCETTDAVIYYTLDGTTPSESSKKYENAFTITANCTVKAIAVKAGMAPSEAASAELYYTATFQANVPYYIDTTDCEWYSGSIKVFDKSNNVLATATNVEGQIYTFTLTQDNVTSVIIKRGSNDSDVNHNSVTVNADATNNCIYIKNDNGTAAFSKWGTYTPSVASYFTPGTYYIDLEGANFWAGDGPSLNVKIGDQTISPVRINVNYYSFTITDANISSVYITRTKGGDTWGSATVYPPTNNEDVIWIKTNGSSGGHLDNEWTTQMELPENVYLHYTDWKDNNQAKSVKLNKEGNCYFTTTQAVSSKGLVRFSNGLTGDDLVYYGYASSGYTPSSLNDPIKLQKDRYEFDATEGYLNFFVDFSDRRNPKVTVTPQSPHRLSIRGAVKMNGATSADGFEMEWNNGTLFTLNNVTINGDFNFVNPGTGIVYGARGGDVTLEMQSPADKVYAQGYPRRRSTSVWKLKDFDKDQVYDIKVSFMNPRNPSMRIEKHVDPMETPEKLYIIGNHIGDNPWEPEHAMEMTKNGDTFTYIVRKYKANEDGYFRFLTSQSFGTQQYGSTEMNVEFKVDAYMPLQAGANNWKFNHNSDGNYIVTVNFKTGKVHVAFSEGNAKDNLYLVGDVNKWLNDGHYDYTDDNNETKSVSYGYDPAVHGVRDKWQLKEYAPAEGQNPPAFMNDGSTWYYLDIPECSAIPKTLFGQFTIYQGTWNQHTKDNVTYYTPSWNAGEGFNQYANSFQKDNDSYLTTEAAIKYNKVFTNVTYVHNGKTDVDDDNVYVSNSNLKLADNFYQNATLFLCPDKKAIYVMVNSDDDVKNITIYYANEKATESDKPVITANGSSINTTNYRLDTNIFNGEMEYHEGPALINGISYDRYWTKQVRPGMENPAGQKITVTISNVSTVSSDNWATIRGNDVYFLDGIHLFVEPKSEIKVEKIEFRIYGYSLDGSSIVVSNYKGDNVYSVDAPDFDSYEDAWTELYSGTFDSGKFNDAKHSLEEGVWTASLDGTHFSTKSTDDAHMIVPSQGTKFVQYRIKYTEVSSPSQKGIRKANGVRTELVPDTFRTDTPEGATWVLNGKHKLYTPGLETGVEDIFGDEFTEDGEEVETIYYNLQGQRVDNPDKGLYIRVRGTKTDKVLF